MSLYSYSWVYRTKQEGKFQIELSTNKTKMDCKRYKDFAVHFYSDHRKIEIERGTERQTKHV